MVVNINRKTKINIKNGYLSRSYYQEYNYNVHYILLLLFQSFLVQVQKSAVLQKTIDYIRYLENMNRKLRDENRQLKTLLGGQSQGQSLLIIIITSDHTRVLQVMDTHWTV